MIGIGALGCLFGARLGAVAPVTLVGRWAAQREALQRHGLAVEAAGGELQQYSPKVEEEAENAPAEIALVLLKSHQRREAARRAAAVLGASGGLALTLQNGLGHREHLASALGQERVAVGVTSEGARVIDPGRVLHAGDGVTRIAPPPGGDSPLLSAFIDCLRKAGFTTELVPRIDELLWGKLAINAAINPLTAVLGVPNGELAKNPELAQWCGRVAEEVAAVARLAGVEIPYRQAGDAAQAALAVCRGTASNRSSMLQDIEAGRPTEIDAICGAVVRAAADAGAAAPLNGELLARVRALSAGAAASPTSSLIISPAVSPSASPSNLAPSAFGRWLDQQLEHRRIQR
ncbi:MAG: 2-dehydropantoate 2-reductase [Acidobacteriota bacterium]